MKLLLTIVFVVASLWVVASEPEKGGENNKRDTVHAVVMYGEELLFDAVSGLTDAEVLSLCDSIIAHHGVNELTNTIELYLSLKNKTEESLTRYVDSLFDADENVPYALINQINIFLANKPEDVGEINAGNICYGGVENTPYPAMCFYPEWKVGTPNPYSPKLWENDTAFSLLLAGAGVLGEFHLPHNGMLTSKFGWRDGRMHNGIDIDLNVWDSVVAAFPGVVRVARAYGGYGRVVVIRHYNGLETTYAHLHRFKVKEGDVVQGGQLIGLGGSSGHSTGSHLHFEVRFKGVPINPMSFISIEDKALLNDTLMLKRVKNGFVAYPKGVLFHTVKRGDSLYNVAKQYGVSVNKLAELNGIRRNSYLYVGQRLRVI